MKRFQYLRPASLKEALEQLAAFQPRVKPLIGGTDLMVRIQKGQAEVDAVVDLKGIQDISSTIEKGSREVTIGSLTVISDISADEDMRAWYPALIEAARTVGSIQIRNRATLTGNICNASPAADTVPPLIAYDTDVEIAGVSGGRTVALRDFFIGPGKTVCGPDELVVSVRIPVPEKPDGAAFERLTRRKGVDLATINIACRIDATKRTIFVFGAAGPTAIVAEEASGIFADADSREEEHDEVLRSLVGRTNPISDVRAGKEYREAMLFALGKRALNRARRRYGKEAGWDA